MAMNERLHIGDGMDILSIMSYFLILLMHWLFFQHLMNDIFYKFLDNFVIFYLD